MADKKEMKICPGCSQKFPAKFEFCPKCGAKVEGSLAKPDESGELSKLVSKAVADEFEKRFPKKDEKSEEEESWL